ncbi:hypothetical protein [Saccharopolyspora taberi]|uniref:Serine hydrolase n=1 Tax=Saccharopolyspora taberi TaxID=60895 RepID=A0ABN3VMK0_9PSEU
MPDIPNEVTAGYLVVGADGAVAARDERLRFRSASLVKLHIALDYLENLGPGREIPAADRAPLERMLRASNDDAASELWERAGQTEVIGRMVDLIGLRDTTPPDSEGMWGYTAISAADVIRTYRWILREARPRVRDFIMGNLRKHTRWADDGFDQSFGLPSATGRPAAVKQGWSGFGPAARKTDRTSDVDLTRPAMHTSGAVGGTLVAVLTLEPEHTDWETAANRTTELTRSLLEPLWT